MESQQQLPNMFTQQFNEESIMYELGIPSELIPSTTITASRYFTNVPGLDDEMIKMCKKILSKHIPLSVVYVFKDALIDGYLSELQSTQGVYIRRQDLENIINYAFKEEFQTAQNNLTRLNVGVGVNIQKEEKVASSRKRERQRSVLDSQTEQKPFESRRFVEPEFDEEFDEETEEETPISSNRIPDFRERRAQSIQKTVGKQTVIPGRPLEQRRIIRDIQNPLSPIKMQGGYWEWMMAATQAAWNIYGPSTDTIVLYSSLFVMGFPTLLNAMTKRFSQLLRIDKYTQKIMNFYTLVLSSSALVTKIGLKTQELIEHHGYAGVYIANVGGIALTYGASGAILTGGLITSALVYTYYPQMLDGFRQARQSLGTGKGQRYVVTGLVYSICFGFSMYMLHNFDYYSIVAKVSNHPLLLDGIRQSQKYPNLLNFILSLDSTVSLSGTVDAAKEALSYVKMTPEVIADILNHGNEHFQSVTGSAQGVINLKNQIQSEFAESGATLKGIVNNNEEIRKGVERAANVLNSAMGNDVERRSVQDQADLGWSGAVEHTSANLQRTGERIGSVGKSIWGYFTGNSERHSDTIKNEPSGDADGLNLSIPFHRMPPETQNRFIRVAQNQHPSTTTIKDLNLPGRMVANAVNKWGIYASMIIMQGGLSLSTVGIMKAVSMYYDDSDDIARSVLNFINADGTDGTAETLLVLKSMSDANTNRNLFASVPKETIENVLGKKQTNVGKALRGFLMNQKEITAQDLDSFAKMLSGDIEIPDPSQPDFKAYKERYRRIFNAADLLRKRIFEARQKDDQQRSQPNHSQKASEKAKPQPDIDIVGPNDRFIRQMVPKDKTIGGSFFRALANAYIFHDKKNVPLKQTEAQDLLSASLRRELVTYIKNNANENDSTRLIPFNMTIYQFVDNEYNTTIPEYIEYLKNKGPIKGELEIYLMTQLDILQADSPIHIYKSNNYDSPAMVFHKNENVRKSFDHNALNLAWNGKYGEDATFAVLYPSDRIHQASMNELKEIKEIIDFENNCNGLEERFDIQSKKDYRTKLSKKHHPDKFPDKEFPDKAIFETYFATANQIINDCTASYTSRKGQKGGQPDTVTYTEKGQKLKQQLSEKFSKRYL